MFGWHGYEATSIEDVLAASGVSRGALYHHFAGKTELFEAVLEHVEEEMFDRIRAQAAAAGSAREAVRLGALGFLAEARDPIVRRLVLTDAPAVLGWARWRELDGRYAFGALRAGLDAAVSAGELDVDADLVDSFAHILLASLMELALMSAPAGDRGDGDRNAVRAVERLLDGLWKAPGPANDPE